MPKQRSKYHIYRENDQAKRRATRDALGRKLALPKNKAALRAIADQAAAKHPYYGPLADRWLELVLAGLGASQL
jgi:hypothetical protein